MAILFLGYTVPQISITEVRLFSNPTIVTLFSLVHTVHARETASDLIQATRISDDAIARRYRQIMQEYLDKTGGESVPRQTGRPVSD